MDQMEKKENVSQQKTQDNCLLNRLQNLDLETGLTSRKRHHDETRPPNPFMRRRRSKSLSSINFGVPCDCASRRNLNVKHTTSFKRSKKILRDPVLKLIKCDKNCTRPFHHKRKEKQFGQCSRHKDFDFKSIVDACEKLHLNGTNKQENTLLQSPSSNSNSYTTSSFLNLRSRTTKNFTQLHQFISEQTSTSSSTASNLGTCSHQARMNVLPSCDVTIDELASYFETFVHIPKKMSSMAEMMYI